MLASVVLTSAVIATVSLLQPPSASQSDLQRAVEGQRGGRHWIDQPTDPPKSPAESSACFEIEPGYRIHLIASEPVITDPVAIDFDHRGRMFVVEYTDYPIGPKDPSALPLSQIVLLEDIDGDGQMDKRTVFASHINFCHSLMAFKDGILTCSDSQILYLADTNGDNVADVREVWFDGFTAAHPQMQIGCPRWGFDNWIYLTYGHGKVRCTRPGFESKEPVEIPRVDFRFHPETMQFEAISGAGQFGNTIDSYGRRYFSSNRNPIMHDVLSLAEVRKNPFAGVNIGHTDIGPSGEKTRVFPRVAMKSNWLSHAGTHTSACGVTAYRGGLFGLESDQSIFVCEPVGHLITRTVIEPQGGTLTARRAREEADFLTSTDTWFRPASLATGPEGALYIADMYRLWVEHPKFVPDDVAAKMDWRAGEDRGRIWRVVPEEPLSATAAPSTQTIAELVDLLRSPNGWRRLLGQRLIVERNLVEAENLLRSLLNDKQVNDKQADGLARLHALWTLDGLDRLTTADLSRAAVDAHPSVRRDAARLIRVRGENDPLLQSAVAWLSNDADGEVRMRAILAINPDSESAQTTFLQAVPGSLNDKWLQTALLISAPMYAADIAEAVVRQSASGDPNASHGEFLRSLALNVAARGSEPQLQKLAALIGSREESGSWWQTALVIGMADGLPRGQNSAIPKSLAALLDKPPASLADRLQPIANVVRHASDTALDTTRSEADRISAMGLMAHLPPETLKSTLESLLKSGESTGCQRAAIDAARRSGRPELAELVLSRWDQLTLQTRSAALDLMLLRKESIALLLDRMTAEIISPSVVSIDQRLILLQHPEESIRTNAAKLFGGTVSANRREVADQYAAALELKSDAVRGAAVFEKTCSKCHRINNVGHNVGPDITDTRARARDALLYDILDPNRRVDPQFSEYVVVTTDGRLFNGLLIAESPESVTVRQPEGREQTIPRTEIEELKSTNKSLMPEGIERDVTVQQMADILEYLKAR